MSVAFEDITTKAELIVYHEKHGSGHYFAADTMRFFSSRTLEGVTHCNGSVLFVTSERCEGITPRRYTIRVMGPRGNIDTFGIFQEYCTADRARRKIARIAAVHDA